MIFQKSAKLDMFTNPKKYSNILHDTTKPFGCQKSYWSSYVFCITVLKSQNTFSHFISGKFLGRIISSSGTSKGLSQYKK